jgi:hypothetical protein
MKALNRYNLDAADMRLLMSGLDGLLVSGADNTRRWSRLREMLAADIAAAERLEAEASDLAARQLDLLADNSYQININLKGGA